MLISSLTVPPAPEQDRLKLVFVVKASITIEPAVALLPDQPPEALQLLALVVFHVRVVEPFCSTVFGLAEKDSTGTGASRTVIVTESLAEPPAPVQVKV